MSILGESLRALSPQREAQFAFSRTVRNGVVPKFPAGQAQQDGPPQPPQVCPASFTQTPASPAKEFK